jgi:hypothetical protein
VVDEIEGAVDVHVHAQAPARGGVVESRPRGCDRGVVDQEIAAAELLEDALGEGCDGLVVAHVEGDGERTPPLGLHLRGRLLDGAGQPTRRVRSRPRRTHDVVSLLREVDAELPADSPAGPRDERDLRHLRTSVSH